MNSSSTERRQLVSFGLIMAAALAFLAWYFALDLLFVIAALFVTAAVLVPSWLSALYRPWMRLAEALGWINTRILLMLIYFLVVTPIGVLMRLLRRSPLATAERNGSFWADPPKHSWGDKHFEKQF